MKIWRQNIQKEECNIISEDLLKIYEEKREELINNEIDNTKVLPLSQNKELDFDNIKGQIRTR